MVTTATDNAAELGRCQHPSDGAHGCAPYCAYSLVKATFWSATEAWPAVPEYPSCAQVDGRIPNRPADDAVGLSPLSRHATHCSKEDIPAVSGWLTLLAWADADAAALAARCV